MRKEDSVQSIFAKAAYFFFGTLLSRISGLIRDISMAYAFGATSAVSLFLVAFRFSHLLRRLFGESALHAGFIPIYEEIKSQKPLSLRDFFLNNAFWLSFILILVITSLMCALFLFIRISIFSSSTNEILYYTALMLPGLLFICLFGLNSALLQAEDHFFIPSAAPLLFNLVWIFGALILSPKSSSAMPYLSFFIVLAAFAQWLVTCPLLFNKLKKMPGSFKLNFKFEDVKKLFKPVSLGMIGIAATQINSALDSVFALATSSQGPSYLWYAIRIEQLPLSLFGVALSSALLPSLSRCFKEGSLEKGKAFLSSTLAASSIILLPLMAALFISGETVLSLIFNHGRFSENAVSETAYCLFGYAIGLLPQAVVMILAPCFYAQKQFDKPVIASIAAVFFNIFLNSLFVLLGFGPAFIAFATSLSAYANATVLYLQMEPQIKKGLFFSFRNESFKAILATGAFIILVLSFEMAAPLKKEAIFEKLFRFSTHSAAFIISFSYLWWQLIKNMRLLKRAKAA